MKSDLSKKLIVIGLSFGLSLLLVEGGVRLYWESFKRENPGHHKLFCEPDPLLGWRNIPNKTGVHKTAEYEVTESFNSHGHRGPERSFQKVPGTRRAVVLGDSFVEGYSVDYESLFTTVAERHLNRKSSHTVEVINVGTGGYSTDQQYLQFRERAYRYSPDVVALFFYANDIYYNTQSHYFRGSKPLFEPNGDGLKLLPPDVGDAKKRVVGNSSPFRWYSWGWLKRTLKNSALFRSFVPAAIPPEREVWRNTPKEIAVNAWDRTTLLLNALQAEVRKRGARLLVFYVPSRVELDSHVWRATRSRYGMEEGKWSPRNPWKKLKSTCVALKLKCHDLLPELSALGSAEDYGYYVRDGHWNVKGNMRVGEFFAKVLEDELFK